MAGLGFNGYDKNGNPLWNKLQNMNPFGLEVCGFLVSHFTDVLSENV